MKKTILITVLLIGTQAFAVSAPTKDTSAKGNVALSEIRKLMDDIMRLLDRGAGDDKQAMVKKQLTAIKGSLTGSIADSASDRKAPPPRVPIAKIMSTGFAEDYSHASVATEFVFVAMGGIPCRDFDATGMVEFIARAPGKIGANYFMLVDKAAADPLFSASAADAFVATGRTRICPGAGPAVSSLDIRFIVDTLHPK